MPLFSVVVEAVVRTAYEVEAISPEMARAVWNTDGDECGPMLWEDCKNARIVGVEESDPYDAFDGDPFLNIPRVT